MPCEFLAPLLWKEIIPNQGWRHWNFAEAEDVKLFEERARLLLNSASEEQIQECQSCSNSLETFEDSDPATILERLKECLSQKQNESLPTWATILLIVFGVIILVLILVLIFLPKK